MKLRAGDKTDELQKTILGAAARGAVLGGAISLGIAAILKYKAPRFFQTKSGFLQSLVFATPAAFCTITSMEFGSQEFEQRMRDQDPSNPMGKILANANSGVEKKQGLSEFFEAYKYQTIVTAWAAAMGGSFWMVNRDKYMTKAQKIVQARVYAQGLTVLLLLASVAFSVSGASDNKDKVTEQKREDSARSWERNVKFVSPANSK